MELNLEDVFKHEGAYTKRTALIASCCIRKEVSDAVMWQHTSEGSLFLEYLCTRQEFGGGPRKTIV